MSCLLTIQMIEFILLESCISKRVLRYCFFNTRPCHQKLAQCNIPLHLNQVSRESDCCHSSNRCLATNGFNKEFEFEPIEPAPGDPSEREPDSRWQRAFVSVPIVGALGDSIGQEHNPHSAYHTALKTARRVTQLNHTLMHIVNIIIG